MHLGGLIAPGLITAQKAVLDATRFGVRAQVQSYASGLGKDTESCVRQGAVHACLGLVERAARLAQGARVLTGGDAPSLQPHLGRDWQWRPHLVLEGLRALAKLEGAA
jgi:type III pantothenate kinase